MTTPGDDQRPAPGPSSRILVIEDDPALGQSLVAVLEDAGFDVAWDRDGERFAATVEAVRPDLVILDVGLPGEADGFALGTMLRSSSSVPFVFVTAADGLEDRLRGFDLGADDYLVKPFALAELVARVRVVLLRTGRLVSAVHVVRDLVVDEAERVAVRDGHPLALTKTEFDVLAALARRPGRVMSKLRLLSTVWGFDQYDPNVVEVHVSALRRKLEAHGPRLIHTERGAGYSLGPPRSTGS